MSPVYRMIFLFFKSLVGCIASPKSTDFLAPNGGGSPFMQQDMFRLLVVLHDPLRRNR